MTTDTSSDAAGGRPRPSGRSSRPPGRATTAGSSSTSSTEPGDVIEAGRIGRPHGLDGSFHVTRPDPDLLRTDVPVLVAGVSRAVVRRAGTDAKPVVRLRGIDSREAIEALRGEPLWVDRSVAPPLEPDEWWAKDLIGLAVVDGDRDVGQVARVIALPSCEVLEVGELLIPLVGDAVREVDLARRRVDVDLEYLGES